MVRSRIAEETIDVLAVDPDDFQEQVAADAETIIAEIDAGTFDNPQGIVGLEYEFYAVDAHASARADVAGETYGALTRVPRPLLSLIGFEKELGLHNAEMSTSPQPMNIHGLDAQESAVKATLESALTHTTTEGIRLVSDAIWTIPPIGETADEYLTDCVEVDGVTVATNMSDAARYHAMANSPAPAGMRIDVPHATLQAETVLPESLITSIQPHYQVPRAERLPEYFRYAIRIAGPLLALGVNSPFLPPDIYDEGATPEDILADAWMEHRISIFETTMNGEGVRKVRFPRDVDSVEAAVTRIAEDDPFVPMPVERQGRFDDAFAHFRMKHGTFWRWVRPVFGGASESTANARIEFRPIPAQPTIRDSIAFQAAFAALVEDMHAKDHPVADLDWRDARDNFYAAMREGLAADLRWVTAEGVPTTDTELVYEDILETAADGLRSRGLSEEAVWRYLGPLRERVRRQITPARWKYRAVRDRLDDTTLADAIHDMQREYIRRQERTLLDGSFVEWIRS